MENIVNELIKLNQRDWFDIGTVVIPIILSVLIVIQNIHFARRSAILQKEIHNREWAQQYHENILLLYNTYYEFTDVIVSSGFSNNVRCGNVNAATGWLNNLQTLKTNILRRRDLAKLLFERKNPELYNIIKMCFEGESTIIDKYITYIVSGKLLEISEDAWNTVCQIMTTYKYNYTWLSQNKKEYDKFMRLCHSEELIDIEHAIEKDNELHNYENFKKEE